MSRGSDRAQSDGWRAWSCMAGWWGGRSRRRTTRRALRRKDVPQARHEELLEAAADEPPLAGVEEVTRREPLETVVHLARAQVKRPRGLGLRPWRGDGRGEGDELQGDDDVPSTPPSSARRRQGHPPLRRPPRPALGQRGARWGGRWGGTPRPWGGNENGLRHEALNPLICRAFSVYSVGAIGIEPTTPTVSKAASALRSVRGRYETPGFTAIGVT